MRKINRGNYGGYKLENANKNPPAMGESKSRWNSFKGHVEVSAILSQEQFGLCGYSETRPDLDELGSHIEHIKPKSTYPSSTFDFKNLMYCALSDKDLQNIQPLDRFGGHAKLDAYEANKFLNCVDFDVSDYFMYSLTGEILPNLKSSVSDQSKATYTIDLLNLNSPLLVVKRKNWIKELDELIDQSINDKDELHYLAMVYLLPVNGNLDNFFTAARSRFGIIAEECLNLHCRELLSDTQGSKSIPCLFNNIDYREWHHLIGLIRDAKKDNHEVISDLESVENVICVEEMDKDRVLKAIQNLKRLSIEIDNKELTQSASAVIVKIIGNLF